MQQLDRKCPECGAQMAFSGDGKALICDRCGHKKPLNKSAEKRTLAQFKQLRSLSAPSKGNTSLRTHLNLAVSLFQAGELNEACDHFEKVLLSNPSNDEELTAWLWLSKIYENPADKRECLEEVLAINSTHGEARRELAVLDGRIRPEDLIDPNQVAESKEKRPEKIQSEHMRCPRCSSPMNFNAEHTAYLCDYCHYQEVLADQENDLGRDEQFGQGAFEQDFTAALNTAKGHLKPTAMRVLQCQTCGVQFILSPKTLSVTCTYCSSVYVTEAAENKNLIPPQALIPFASDKAIAFRTFKTWLKEKGYLQNHDLRFSPINGLYIPIWTFDVTGFIKWTAQIKENINGQEVWKTRTGEKPVFYDDHLVPAITHQSTALRRALERFDFSKLVAYDPRFLADWPGERYKIKLADASLIARKEIISGLRKYPEQIVSASFGQEVNNIRLDTNQVVIESFKLILLPLWFVHVQEKEKKYDLVMNGQTQEIFSDKEEASVVNRFMRWLTGK